MTPKATRRAQQWSIAQLQRIRIRGLAPEARQHPAGRRADTPTCINQPEPGHIRRTNKSSRPGRPRSRYPSSTGPCTSANGQPLTSTRSSAPQNQTERHQLRRCVFCGVTSCFSRRDESGRRARAPPTFQAIRGPARCPGHAKERYPGVAEEFPADGLSRGTPGAAVHPPHP